MSNTIYKSGEICKKMGEPCIFAADDGTRCTTTGKCDINSRTIEFDDKIYECKKYNTYCRCANSLGLCTLEGGCVMYKALDIPISDPEKLKQEILSKYEENKKYIEDTIFQLKCIKEHLSWLLKNTDENNIEYDISVLDTCVKNLDKVKEYYNE